ncbi:MAG: ABC transporter permease [Acidobacteria bacterium]|nr:ABC transporter permease [Acidobacteriota bacterium]
MNSIWQDIRFEFRTIYNTPTISLIALLTLALGIGATTIIFSLIHTVLIQPLPYPNADRLVMLWEKEKTGEPSNTSFSTVMDWTARSQTLEAIAAMTSWQPTANGQGDPERLSGIRVSASFFHILGIKPVLGRDFRPEDDHPDTRRVVIMSHGLWQRRFGSDPNIIGKTISLSETPFTVIGVLPSDFDPMATTQFYEKAEIWSPLGYDLALPQACRTCRHITAMGLINSGISFDQAKRELTGIGQALFREYPTDYPDPGIVLNPLQTEITRKTRPILFALFGAVSVVLLIACSNIANLLLAFIWQRQKELAIRASVGASRWRLIQQLLTEGLVLGGLSGLIGVMVAIWGTPLLEQVLREQVPTLSKVSISIPVLVFSLGITLLASLLFSLAPVIQIIGLDVQKALKAQIFGPGSGSANRMQSGLVVTQVAFALMLLIISGLLLKSFVQVYRISPGFETEHVLTLSLTTTGPKYTQETTILQFYDQILSRIQTLPGVESAGIVSNLPFGGNMDSWGVQIQDRPLTNQALAPSAERYGITPGYLTAMRIPVLAGRNFSAEDHSQGQLVALVNETMAQQTWPGENPLGKQIKVGGDSPWRTVIGVVGDVRHYRLESKPTMQVYVPESQGVDAFVQLVVKGKIDPASLTTSIQSEIWAVDPNRPVYKIAPMKQLVSATIAQRQLLLWLVGSFSGVALILAVIGIYGVLSYSAYRRTKEIGIRMALGALKRDILRLIVGQGFNLAMVGIGAGLFFGMVVSHLLAGFLFEVSPVDGLTLAGVSFLVLAITILASYLPARRAVRVNPMVALRNE